MKTVILGKRSNLTSKLKKNFTEFNRIKQKRY